MNVLVTGSGGFIGMALLAALAARGDSFARLSRRPAFAPGGGPTWDPGRRHVDLAPAGVMDAVVHLAGEPIAQRWTEAARRRIRDSRVEGTRLLAGALAQLSQPPRVLVCASAAGFYGNCGAEWLEERGAAGSGFLAEVAQAWEAAAAPAIKSGIRVVHLRFGIVLSRAGGALAKMLPAFRCGLGGRLGDGRQYWSWVSLEDSIAAILHALDTGGLNGPVNVVAPNPVTNAEFTRALAEVLRRPARLPVPRAMIRLVFGQMGEEALLGSCRVRPARLLECGFEFLHPSLEEALRATLKPR